MIVHVFVAQTRIDLTLLWNRKEVVISSDFLAYIFSVTSSRDRLDFKMLSKLRFKRNRKDTEPHWDYWGRYSVLQDHIIRSIHPVLVSHSAGVCLSAKRHTIEWSHLIGRIIKYRCLRTYFVYMPIVVDDKRNLFLVLDVYSDAKNWRFKGQRSSSSSE